MAYKLFISYTEADSLLARTLSHQLNNHFLGAVDTFLAKEDIKTGQDWRDTIRRELKLCDGLVSIVTTSSVSKPWIFVEWAAFWLEELPRKDIYVLTTESIRPADLISPMTDRQFAVMTSLDHMRTFLGALGEKAGAEKVPYSGLEPLLDAIRNALRQQRVAEYERLRDNLDDLPPSDDERARAAAYYVEIGDFDTFSKVIELIRVDYHKVGLGIELIENGHADRLELLTRRLRGTQNIAEIVFALIDHGFEDPALFMPHLELIVRRDEAQLSTVCRVLAETDKASSALFQETSNLITNMAELRKAAMALVDAQATDQPAFADAVKRLGERNRVELRKLGEYLIARPLPDSGPIFQVLDVLRQENKEQFSMLRASLDSCLPDTGAAFRSRKSL